MKLFAEATEAFLAEGLYQGACGLSLMMDTSEKGWRDNGGTAVGLGEAKVFVVLPCRACRNSVMLCAAYFWRKRSI